MRSLLIAALIAAPAVTQAQETLPLADLMAATHIHDIAAVPDGPDSATLATHHGLFALDLRTGQARPIGESRDDFMGFSPSPKDAKTAFASGHPATGGNLGIIRSTDGGKTWQPLAEGVGGPVDFHNMEVSHADPSVLYGISHDGAVQRSADGGATWVISGAAPERLIDIATSSTDPDTLYAATEGGLFQTTDAGQSWTAMTPPDRPVTTVDTGPDGILRAVQIGGGLLAWSQGQTEPTQIVASLPGGYLISLSVLSTDSLRLMALSGDGALVLSDDGGATWTELVDTARD